jgi:hypothetical protein
MNLVLKAPGTQRLMLKYGESLLNFAFNFNLRHYIMEDRYRMPDHYEGTKAGACTRPPLSST